MVSNPTSYRPTAELPKVTGFRGNGRPKRILSVFGTRPEIIKMAPVIYQLEQWPEQFQTINVATGQHSDLLYPFIDLFKVRVDYNLRVMDADQTPAGVCARILMLLDPILQRHKPDM